MDKKQKIRRIQEELLCFLPQWNSYVTRPFKQTLEEGISMEMYFSIQMLRWLGGTATMTELGHAIHTPKQHVTKIVNRLVKYQFVERVYDPADRRIIKIQLTDRAIEYIDHFLDEDARCFADLLEQMDDGDLTEFHKAIQTIMAVFEKIPRSNSDTVI